MLSASTSPMKMIGYWITSLADEEYPAPQEVVGALEPGIRTILADYLDSDRWPEIDDYCGLSWCRFFCGVSDDKMGSSEVSDGIWAWPEGLSHYVREHNVLLPQDFIAHVLNQGGNIKQFGAYVSPPTTAPLSEDIESGSSLNYWREWVATRRSRDFLDHLHRARVESDERANGEEERLIAELFAELIAEHGLGNDACIWAGCDEKVLSGMAVCPQHYLANSLADSLQSARSQHFYITPEFMNRCFGPKTVHYK